MKLYKTNFKAIVDKEELPETEIKMLYKKSGKKSFKISFSILSIIMIISIPYYWIAEKEVPLLFILFFVFLCLPMTIESFKQKNYMLAMESSKKKLFAVPEFQAEDVYLCLMRILLN